MYIFCKEITFLSILIVLKSFLQLCVKLHFIHICLCLYVDVVVESMFFFYLTNNSNFHCKYTTTHNIYSMFRLIQLFFTVVVCGKCKCNLKIINITSLYFFLFG